MTATLPDELLPIAPAPADPRADALMVPMRDGVRLATDIYLPDPPVRRAPVVLVRLPYDKCGRYTFMPEIARYLNAHGFAAVVQDVRGKFRSEGRAYPFANEAADGSDTLDWIISQSWSDGTVGMLGDSYYGFTQWAAAATGHPALRAIVPRVTGSHFLEELHPRRVPKIPLYEWVVHTFAANDMYEPPVLSQKPVGGLEIIPEPLAHMRDTICELVEQTGSGELARRAFPGGAPARRLAIPALHTGGWFDNLQKWQLDDWRTSAATAPAAAHQFLRMNVTDHEDFLLLEDGRAPSDHEVDDDALRVYLPRLLDEPIGFLRHYLAGRDGAWAAPRVRYRVAYAGWEVADRWAPDLTAVRTLHCADGAAALRDADGGALTQRPEGTATRVAWVHDPQDPVPYSIASEWGMCAGLPDESVVHGRRDVATFTTAAQDAPCDLLGPAHVELTIAAESPTTHVIARLLDVAPDGSARFVLEGAALVETGGEPARARVRLGDTAYRVRPGHRLRLAISTSSFPQYLVHPGTGESPLTASESRAARQWLTVGGTAGARLELTVHTGMPR